jgi:hypothetical protein
VYTPKAVLRIDHAEVVTHSLPHRLVLYVWGARGPEEVFGLALAHEQVGPILARWATAARTGAGDLTVGD